MAKAKQNDTQKVTELIQKLDKPFGDLVERTRQIILGSDKEIGEQIKWNSPAFYFTGEMKPFDPKEYKRDIVVMNLRNNKLLLIFPTCAVLKDSMGILEGNYEDGRRMITILNATDLSSKAAALREVIKTWISLVDK